MASSHCTRSINLRLLPFSFLATLSFFLLLLNAFVYVSSSKPIIFSFGDSNSDTGALVAGLGYSILPPNGRVYFKKSTGRLSDGRLILDFLSETCPEFDDILIRVRLLEERDRSMAYCLYKVVQNYSSIVAILGQHHFRGIKTYWRNVEKDEALKIQIVRVSFDWSALNADVDCK